MIIGCSGYGRTGKDTVGLCLIEEYGYTRRAFADPLKNAVLALDPRIGQTMRVSDIVNAYGWDVAKGYPEVRSLLQRFGTEVGRNLFGNNFWVELSTRDLAPDNLIVFTDVRFPAEAEAVKNLGGQVWRIHRNGFTPVNGHQSEIALDNWAFDKHIYNNGTKEDLNNVVRLAMDELHRNAAPISA